MASGEDVKEIFRRAVEKDERNYAVRDQYTFREESTVEFLDKDGRPKSVERRTKEVLFFDGTQLERLVAKDGKPLSEKEAQKEKERIDREIAKMKRESASARAKRRGETAAALKEETEGRRQVMEALDLTLKGEEVVAGRPCWLIHGKPRADFKPKGRRADQLKKFQGGCVYWQGDVGLDAAGDGDDGHDLVWVICVAVAAGGFGEAGADAGER